MTFALSRRGLAIFIALLLAALSSAAYAPAARADTYVPISGAGSTWSSNALDQWRRNVQQYGMTVNYNATGSSDGRNQFKSRTVDFGVSEIPYGLTDGGVKDYPPKAGTYAYMPIVAGGTAFMYNLKIGNQQVTNLRLSGDVLAKIFTNNITNWSDPAIAADNPGLTLPARKIVPVVRSDGSGTTAQLTTWLSKTHQSLWDGYCGKAGRSTPCGVTSTFPVLSGTAFTAQSGSNNVAGYVSQAQSQGAITYVEYSYALETGFPVVKMLNAANYYVAPTPSNVAVGLLQAQINNDSSSDSYLTQDLTNVYSNPDPRAYPLSSYSYMIIPTATDNQFSTDKGHTLGAFDYYFLCEGQQQAPALGYSPLPINLVQAGLAQVRRIPGVNQQNVNIAKCNNPTFSSDGSNTLAKNAPQPSACDKLGVTLCATATGGATTDTKVSTTGTSAGGAATTGGAPATTRNGAAAGATGAKTTRAATAKSTANGQKIDPDTGQDVGDDADNGTDGTVNAQPVSMAQKPVGRTQTALILLTVLFLIGLAVGPPLLTRLLRRNR